MKTIYALVLVLFIFSCSEQKEPESIEKKPIITSPKYEWNEISCGLYINSKGEIAFASAPKYANISMDSLSKLYPDKEICPNQFITVFGAYEEDTTFLKDVIDTTSFEYLGQSYYKDKNHIYSHQNMCDGGYFRIAEFIDYDSFHLLGNCCYAKDKNQIIFARRSSNQVDYESFEVSKKYDCFARDINGYYDWGEKLTDEELKDPLNLEMIHSF